MQAEMAEPLTRAQELVRAAKRIVVFSGAGLSKASGIPTYREADGLWSSEDNFNFSTGAPSREDPVGFHKFWDKRIERFLAAQPNAAHHALVKLQRQRPQTRLITQNVDGLLNVAGASDVLELHGSMRRRCCKACGKTEGPWPFGRCLRCFQRARPDVVLFGEVLDDDVWSAARLAASECDLMVVVGTMCTVYPAAEIPQIALRFRAKMIVIDPKLHVLEEACTEYLCGAAETTLPLLFEY